MIVSFVLLAVVTYLLVTIFRFHLPKNFPPGPKCYPIVGASMLIGKLGKTSTQSFVKLGEMYGPVTGTYLGNIKAIIINGYEATKEFYSKDDFPHRPNLFITSYRWGGRMLGVFFSNGRLWQEQRRFTLRHLRDFGFGKTSMEGLIHEESEECVNSILKEVKKTKDSVISVHDKFGVSVINILWAIMAGVRYKHDDENFKKMLNLIQDSFRAGNIGGGNFVNAYPWLRHLPYFKEEFKMLTAGPEAICDMIELTIIDHKNTREPNSSPRDLIDVYLDAMNEAEKDPESTFSKDQLVQICEDLFAAGAESTSNSIAYAVLHMIRNPECQEKVHEELDQVVGRDRLPSFENKNDLPYTFAVITESFRMTPVAPISVPHFNNEDAKLMGYDVPKGTFALVNFTSTNMDQKYWKDPENFRPERFLDSEGKFSSSKLDHVLGFGAGKRQCLGEPLARISNFLLFTAVLQRFKFDIVPGAAPPTLEAVNGFTIAPQPFSAKVTARY